MCIAFDSVILNGIDVFVKTFYFKSMLLLSFSECAFLSPSRGRKILVNKAPMSCHPMIGASFLHFSPFPFSGSCETKSKAFSY